MQGNFDKKLSKLGASVSANGAVNDRGSRRGFTEARKEKEREESRMGAVAQMAMVSNSRTSQGAVVAVTSRQLEELTPTVAVLEVHGKSASKGASDHPIGWPTNACLKN